MPLFAPSNATTHAERRASRGTHQLYYGEGDALEKLKLAQPGLLVLSSGASLSYGCGSAYVLDFLEVEGKGFPTAYFGSHKVADVTLDSAWKMLVVLMNDGGPENWEPVGFGPFLKKLEAAKGRASPSQKEAFIIKDLRGLYELAKCTAGHIGYPWLDGLAYVPGELFAADGIGSIVLRTLEYYATDVGGLGRTRSEAFVARAAVAPDPGFGTEGATGYRAPTTGTDAVMAVRDLPDDAVGVGTALRAFADLVLAQAPEITHRSAEAIAVLRVSTQRVFFADVIRLVAWPTPLLEYIQPGSHREMDGGNALDYAASGATTPPPRTSMTCMLHKPHASWHTPHDTTFMSNGA